MMYVEDHIGFGLGNFISLTPAIKELYNKHGKINVLFTKEYVKECYKESPYINAIDKPIGQRIFGSELICKANTMTDIEFINRKVLGYNVTHKTFVDEVEPIVGEYGVFINGAGSERSEYVDRKSIPNAIQELIKECSTIDVVGLGSLNDRKRNIFEGEYGDIRKCMSYIKGAKWVISNVTGFYHLAGAYEKNQLVLWKDCLRPRNQNINKNQVISNKDNWHNDIIKFL